MEPIPHHLNKTITVKQAVGVALTIIAGGATAILWVGSISERVVAVEKDVETVSDKMDQLIQDTAYIKGAVDEMRNKRGR